MKKAIAIIVLGLLLSNITFADSKFKYNPDFKNSLVHFNQWLYDNGHHQYLNLDTATVWKNFYGVDKIYDKFIGTNNLNIKGYKGRWTIPFKANPNRDTLIYYLYKYLYSHDTGDRNTKQWGRYEIQPSKKPYEFKSDLREDKFIKKQMQKKAVISYLLFEDDKIVIDEISPKDRFGEFVDNSTKLRAMSVGKSLVSYVAGHAICAGYIDSVESKIDDWPLLKDTLYDGQKLIDILNMRAGDHKYVYNSVFWDGNEADVELFGVNMRKMRGKKKSKPKYNYNVVNTNLIFNYILFKSGDNFEKLLNDVFQKKVRIKDSVYFFREPHKHMSESRSRSLGDANAMFFATRYDYLRISKSIMDDWQNDTCVGKYLKTIYESRVPKTGRPKDEKDSWTNPKGYAGQFHTNYSGMKKRAVMGMDGYGGQHIIIDFDRSRIVAIHSMHQNYNWKKIAHSVISKGK